MSPITNRRWVLAAFPKGVPTRDCYRLESNTIPDLEPGQFLVKMLWLSVDPYQRIIQQATLAYDNPLGAVRIGDVVKGQGIGVVVQSRNGEYPLGSLVTISSGWQEYVVATEAQWVIDYVRTRPALALGALGMPGVTAWVGLNDILEVSKEESGKSIFISGAAGAVGSVLGQLAKAKGLKVFGSAGTDHKCAWCKTELGFDGMVMYKGKDVGQLNQDITTLCPDGIDFYFDNTGGSMTAAVVNSMNTFGRVAVCGQISGYNATTAHVESFPVFSTILMKQLRVRGFLTGSVPQEERVRAMHGLGALMEAGKVKARIQWTDGIESCVEAFGNLFSGKNTGKQLVHVGDYDGIPGAPSADGCFTF